MAGFATLLGLGTALPPTTGDAIRGPLSPGNAVRRRGRATGLTSAKRLTVEVIGYGETAP